jgi:hypothetical protein
MRNATRTLPDNADILRTTSDILGSFPLVIGVMMTIDALESLHAHREEAGRLPRSGALLHQPSGAGVPQSMWRNTLQPRPLTRCREALFHVLDSLAVDVKNVTHLSPTPTGTLEVWQKPRWNRDYAATFARALAARDFEIDCPCF